MSTSTNGTSKWMSRKYSGKTQFSDSVFLLFTVSYWSHNSSIFILHVEYAVLVISDTSGIWFDPYFFSSARKISARTYRNYHLIDIRIRDNKFLIMNEDIFVSYFSDDIFSKTAFSYIVQSFKRYIYVNRWVNNLLGFRGLLHLSFMTNPTQLSNHY